MPQKYEVFHEATQITLCKTPDFINLQAPQSLSLSCSDQEDVDDFVEMLKVGLTADHYILFDQDLKSLWKRFTRAFTVVEAAGGVVRNEKGQILMIYRKKSGTYLKGSLILESQNLRRPLEK